ncbi:unnamed protein product [Paramecium octaurelia]|uniref:Uncharacterized protein n=1 Tax=Paramecium octaurelia TaxID=43137 RepID=A0A8S1XRD4_PAROT|nr:unnamed protein product [Paramecium octaurelia]
MFKIVIKPITQILQSEILLASNVYLMITRFQFMLTQFVISKLQKQILFSEQNIICFINLHFTLNFYNHQIHNWLIQKQGIYYVRRTIKRHRKSKWIDFLCQNISIALSHFNLFHKGLIY